MARSVKPASMQDILNYVLGGEGTGLNFLFTFQKPVSTLLAGANGTITGTAAVALATQVCSKALVQADYGNGTTDLLVGNSAAQKVKLKPGQSITLEVGNLNVIYILPTAGTGTANWIAYPQVNA